MAASAWQLVCGLDAWRVTQISRQPTRLPNGVSDDGDLLTAQRTATLSAAYHGAAGPVGFADQDWNERRSDIVFRRQEG